MNNPLIYHQPRELREGGWCASCLTPNVPVWAGGREAMRCVGCEAECEAERTPKEGAKAA